MLQVVYASKKIKATLEKQIDLRIKQGKPSFCKLEDKVRFKQNEDYKKATSLTVDEFYENNVKKNNYIKSLDKKKHNLNICRKWKCLFRIYNSS